MKILHIINSLATGGAEKLIAETVPLYAKEGITTDLLLLNGYAHPFVQELEDKNCCQIFTLGASSVYHPRHIFGIMPFLEKYDIVHVHLFPAQYYVVIAKILSGAKAKLIFTEHNITNRRLASYGYRIIDKHIYKWYDAVVCITSNIKKILIKHSHLSENKFRLIENGVNLDRIKHAQPYLKEDINSSFSADDHIIIQIAAFREQKDQETLIRAMFLLPASYKLVLVGEGKLKDKNVKLVLELGIQHRVFFLGERMDIPSVLKTADIVVLSSKYEGLSLSSIEGMASGKPFVASDVPGLTETVGGAGVLFQEGDDKKLAEILMYLIDNPEYYQQIVQQCMKRADEFNIEKMVTKHINLYYQLLTEK